MVIEMNYNIVLISVSITYSEHNVLRVTYALDGQVKARNYDIDLVPEEIANLNKGLQLLIAESEHKDAEKQKNKGI